MDAMRSQISSRVARMAMWVAQHTARRLAAIGLTVGCVACGAAEAKQATGHARISAPATSLTQGIGYFAGEQMAFDVRLSGIAVGQADLAVNRFDQQPNATIRVRSRLASSGAAALVIQYLDDATTDLDRISGHPLAFTTEVVHNSTKFSANATFGAHTVDVTYQRAQDAAARPLHFDFRDQPVHDAHSAMGMLRLWQAAAGSTRTVWIIGGRRLWRIDVMMASTDIVATELGNRRATRLTGTAYRARNDLSVDTSRPARTFTVWLSDDADRVPLRVHAKTELGAVEIELAEYQRP